MEFERAQVDYKTLVPVFKNRALVGMKGWRYFPYVVEILALRSLGVKHRAISDWLNTIVPADVPLTNQALSSYLSLWKSGKLLESITKKDIDEVAKKIKDESRSSKNSVTNPNNNFSKVDVFVPEFPNKWEDNESEKFKKDVAELDKILAKEPDDSNPFA